MHSIERDMDKLTGANKTIDDICRERRHLRRIIRCLSSPTLPLPISLGSTLGDTASRFSLQPQQQNTPQPQQQNTPIDLNSYFLSPSGKAKNIQLLPVNTGPPPPVSGYLSFAGRTREMQDSIQLLPVNTRRPPPPVYGYLSFAGRTEILQDTVSINLNLCSPPINRGKPVHFFGVYDGHGGDYVSKLCKNMMHVLMREELMLVEVTDVAASGVAASGVAPASGGAGSDVAASGGAASGVSGRKGKGRLHESKELPWKMAIKKCFERMDETALSYCVCGNSIGQCICHPIELSLTGSTAVVAMLTPELVIVANCGDSRAVICRAGKCIPMSYDHKPHRPDELARIKASGGRVYESDGLRVEGLLTMTRAIGDRFLKKVIISEPEISIMKRHKEDECLILASDGIWDVVSSELACEMASDCLREGISNVGSGEGMSNVGSGENNCQPVINSEGTGFNYPSTCASAATVISRLALSRRSGDDISIVVVDLRKQRKSKS